MISERWGPNLMHKGSGTIGQSDLNNLEPTEMAR